MHKPDREQAIAKTALELMAECSVPATPENFELFYAYASGEAPALAQVMDAMIAARTNVRKTLEELEARYRRLRQEQITEEIIELVR